MSRVRRTCTYMLLLLLAFSFSACENPFAQKKTNWEVSLKKDDKKPYGSYIAYHALPYYFPGARIEPLPDGFRYTSIDASMHHAGSPSLLVLLGLDFYLSAAELEQLIQFAGAGNEIMIFCSRMDEALERRFKCYKHSTAGEGMKLTPLYTGQENIGILSLKPGKNIKYGYEGRSLQSYFTLEEKDTAGIERYITIDDETATEEPVISGPDTLGYRGAMPDFIRYKTGRGHITFHAAPLVLSNYFLLQSGNKGYLDGLWHILPAGIQHIYWNEYYRRRAEASSFSVLLRYPATKWALILALFTLLMYVLFESKRRQKIIPVIEQPENASLSFTETVGRLYYNKGDHSNIAEKMIQHFLDWVRTQHHMNTNHLNYDFIRNLAAKTGETEQTVTRLVEMIHEIRLSHTTPDEAYLYELYTTIQKFYKNNT